MEITITKLEEINVVELVGDIDANTAPPVQEKVLPLAVSEAKILIDMTNVPYMSSAGLRALLSVHRQATAQEAQLVLVGLSEEIKDTMEITGFLEFFTTCDTQASGLEALKIA
ncbi:STAS domain-containing protein [Kamptonema formosum]|uniref:STAS domain-containing protein n=1 Tax=Kamptonema formosum TaxID=331992 RepID=UPI00034AA99B|nr:STAS domain-containing protein [Oscillatoria sp. PCC 10802]